MTIKANPIIAVISVIVCVALLMFSANRDHNSVLARTASWVKAPAFTQLATKDWINSQPLTLQELTGKVVLIDIWTFGCWNCYRSFPWLNEFEKKYKDQGLTVIGVHTPEFNHERDREKIKQKVVEFKLNHPVMVDNDASYWKAINNRYWPTFYLIDKQGIIRGQYIGEIHTGDPRAQLIENKVKQLLSEKY